MNEERLNSKSSSEPSAELEQTMRLLTQIPVPAGIEERVKARLKAAPQTATLLPWPKQKWTHWPLMRGALAATIVFLIGGGAWQVYHHAQNTAPTAHIVPAPPRAGTPGNFSNAGAVRSPHTLDRPVLVRPMRKPDETPHMGQKGRVYKQDKQSRGSGKQ